MENYPYSPYPESGDSSPRSREIDFDNQPWDEQQPIYKARFMCSYGGKILPRPHDNQLSYIGGETKIIAVDRGIKFYALVARLAALCGEADVAFRYQLPGEDLDALISVTNDDDLEHMMHEHDRLYRSSARPARLRLFIFPASPSTSTDSFEPGQAAGSERERFVEALSAVPALDPPKPAPGNVDFLFGLEKGVYPPPPPPQQPVVPDPVGVAAAAAVAAAAPSAPAPVPAHEHHLGLSRDERLFGSDQGMSPAEMQRQLQELQRLQISGHGPEVMYRRKSEEAVAGGYGGGADYHAQKKVSDMAAPVPIPSSIPMSAPAAYWPEKQIPGGAFVGAMTAQPGPPEQPVYVIPSHTGLYHAPPVGRPVVGQAGQGYYAVQQRVGSDAYRDQPVFNVAQPLTMAALPTLTPQQQLQRMPATMSAEAIVAGRQSSGVADHVAYAPAGYDGATGRQVFYTAAGGTPPPPPPQQQYQGTAVVTAEMRAGGQVPGQEGRGRG